MSHKRLFQAVRGIPSLAVALNNMDARFRREHLMSLIRGLGALEGLDAPTLDAEISNHLDFVFAAINDESRSQAFPGEYEESVRAAESLVLLNHYGEKDLKIPHSICKMADEVMACFVRCTNEEEAQGLLRAYAQLYLSVPNQTHEIMRSALNRAMQECSLDRVSRAIITLDDIQTWNFGESIFDSLVFARDKKLIEERPGSIVRDVRIGLMLGMDRSGAADAAVLSAVSRIAEIDRAARSARDTLGEAWTIDMILAPTGIVRLETYTGAHTIAAELEKQARKELAEWENPLYGSVKLDVVVRYDNDVFASFVVEGLPPKKE